MLGKLECQVMFIASTHKIPDGYPITPIVLYIPVIVNGVVYLIQGSPNSILSLFKWSSPDCEHS